MAGLATVISLVVMEALLSVDNSLVNAAAASKLPTHKRKVAIAIGLACAAILRVVALCFASHLISMAWVKIAGGGYLIGLMGKHLLTKSEGEKEHRSSNSFTGAIVQIIMADIVFSMDNVISAVAFSNKISMVILGVLIGIVAMMFITHAMCDLIDKHPSLEDAAYIVVGVVGAMLIAETAFGFQIHELIKLGVLVMVITSSLVYERFRK